MADPWLRANAPLLDAINADRLAYAVDDRANSELDAQHPQLETVGVVAWKGDLIDSYVEGEVGIRLHVHGASPPIDSKRRNLSFVLQHEVSGDLQIYELGPVWDPKERFYVPSPRADDMQPAVSINSGPVVEDRESSIKAVGQLFRLKVGRGVVRLYGFNDGPLLVREWFDFPTGLLEVCSGSADWKLQGGLLGWRPLSGILARDFIDAGVEGCTELVQQFSNFESDRWGDGFGLADPETAVPFIIHITDRFVRVMFNKGVPFVGDSLAMSFGPIDSVPADIKWL